MKLEYVDSLILAHPFIKGFEQVSYCLSEEEVRAVAQGEISDAVASRKKEDIEGKEGAGPVYSTTFYIGLAIEPKQRKCTVYYYSLILDLKYTIFSRICWTAKIGHILSHNRIYEVGQDVGEV